MKILSMSGFVPEQVCDTVRFTQYSGDRNIAHYCGYVSDFISQVLQDDSIDGAVYPKSCDSTRVMTSYLSDSSKFLYQIDIPTYGTSGGLEYFANIIKSYKIAIEQYYDFEIKIEDIRERAEKINLRDESIRKIYQNIMDLSYSDYLKAIHNMLGQPLAEQEWKGKCIRSSKKGKKVFLVGSFLSNLGIVDVIEKSGLSVVGDTLTESGRLISKKAVDTSGDIYREIGKSMLSARLSPTQNSFRDIWRKDFEEIKRKEAKGIIFLTQKYCEPYDYLYSVYKEEADILGIPITRISVNNTQDSGKALLSIEAFAE